MKEQAHLDAHIKAVGAARHLAASLATAADATASDLIAAVEEEKPAIIAKADDDVAVAEQTYARAVAALEQGHRDLAAARGQSGWAKRFPERYKVASPAVTTVPLLGQNGSELTMGTVLAALRSAV